MGDQDDLLACSDDERHQNKDTTDASLANVTIGSFRATGLLGQGAGGGAVFAVEHRRSRRRAAAKWPVPRSEVEVLADLSGASSSSLPCFGVPKLFEQGELEGKLYMVTETLGKPLSHVFRCIKRSPMRFRWLCISIIGRMLLRRLQAVHGRGYIHNDVKPDNVLIGRPTASGHERFMPFLIDFGTAQRFTGNEVLRRDLGSVDFNSIRSGRDLQRRPHDDLEALAWSMLHGLVGELPWFALTRKVDWKDHEQRFDVVKQVQAMKERLVLEGVGFLGKEWKHLERMPQELWLFLHGCQPTKFLDEPPAYDKLWQLLGGKLPVKDHVEADQEDAHQLEEALRQCKARRVKEEYPDGEEDLRKEDRLREEAERAVLWHERARKLEKELMQDTGPIWQVVGGEGRGGVVVRKGQERDSELYAARLSTGALIEEEVLDGERLYYNRLLGDGPNCGWVSLRVKYGDTVKELIVPHELTEDEWGQIQQEKFLLQQG